MTAPQRRRPLPALAFIGALCLLTALVWFRVIHRSGKASSDTTNTCQSPSSSTSSAAAAPTTVVPVPRAVSVLVLNSTHRDGLAGKAKAALLARHFQVTQAVNDLPAYGGHGLVPGVAEIRYGPRGLAGATLLRYYLPGAAMKTTDSSSAVVTVSLGAKYRAVATDAAVRKALVAHHIRFGKPRVHPTVSPSC